MVEKITENKFCRKCGVDVRPNTLFCYNCGAQVATDEEVAAENNKSLTEKKVKAAGADAEKYSTAKLEKDFSGAKNKVKPIQKPTESLNKDQASEDVYRAEKRETSLKTAASMRKRPKTNQQARVRFTWENYENAPNPWFLMAAALLALFAVGMLMAMLYIR